MTKGQWIKHAASFAFALLVAMTGYTALAQFNRSNTFRPSARTHDGCTVDTASDMGHVGFDAQLYVDYASDPLEGAVSKQLTGHAEFGVGFAHPVILLAGVPYHFILHQTG